MITPRQGGNFQPQRSKVKKNKDTKGTKRSIKDTHLCISQELKLKFGSEKSTWL